MFKIKGHEPPPGRMAAPLLAALVITAFAFVVAPNISADTGQQSATPNTINAVDTPDSVANADNALDTSPVVVTASSTSDTLSIANQTSMALNNANGTIVTGTAAQAQMAAVDNIASNDAVGKEDLGDATYLITATVDMAKLISAPFIANANYSTKMATAITCAAYCTTANTLKSTTSTAAPPPARATARDVITQATAGMDNTDAANTPILTLKKGVNCFGIKGCEIASLNAALLTG